MTANADPTQGTEIGTTPFEDPAGGPERGAGPNEDPTQGAETGTVGDEDPTSGREIGAEPYEDPTQGTETGATQEEDPTLAGLMTEAAQVLENRRSGHVAARPAPTRG